jgi:hypothetical protein
MNINKKSVLVLVAVATCFTITGCASNAAPKQMAYIPHTMQKPHNRAFANNITLGSIGGGKETNPLWESKVNNSGLKDALEESLQNANLYASSDKAKYTLNATLNKLDQPIMGLDMTVKSDIHYSLINNNTKQVMYDKNIASSYTASWKTLYGVARLKEANEGAIRTNIEKLMNDLLYSAIPEPN